MSLLSAEGGKLILLAFQVGATSSIALARVHGSQFMASEYACQMNTSNDLVENKWFRIDVLGLHLWSCNLQIVDGTRSLPSLKLISSL